MDNLSSSEIETNRYLADRFAIDDLVTRYTMAVDDADWDVLDTVFTDDAVLDYTAAGGIRGPRDQVKQWLRDAMSPFPVRQHMIGNKRVVIEGDTATVRAYFFNPMMIEGASGETTFAPGGGYYNFRLVRATEGWRSDQLVGEEVWRVGLPDNLGTPPAPELP